jgi:hypothetical protein
MKSTVEPKSEAQEPEPSLSPAPSYDDLAAFLAEHGVTLPAVPRIKSFKTMDAAMKAILKSELIELEKG